MNSGIQYRTIEYLDLERSSARMEKQALADAHKITEYFKEECGAEVFGIGSLFEEPLLFKIGSDIDLIVKGIPPDQFLSITANASIMTRFGLDIIPFEGANPIIRKRLSESGIRL